MYGHSIIPYHILQALGDLALADLFKFTSDHLLKVIYIRKREIRSILTLVIRPDYYSHILCPWDSSF